MTKKPLSFGKPMKRLRSQLLILPRKQAAVVAGLSGDISGGISFCWEKAFPSNAKEKMEQCHYKIDSMHKSHLNLMQII